MSLISIAFDIDILARSSIVHREDYSAIGTDNFALFRREKILTPTGEVILVPIVSGSGFRGILRRIGESLTAAVLNYEDHALPVPAAHLLTNGGRLAKSARPLTDEEERHLKSLLPQIAVFGGAASGRIMSGLLTVGKVLPEIAELSHILPRAPKSKALPAVLGVAEESFSHLSDHRPTTAQPPSTDSDEASSPLGRFGVETLPAGTRLQTWVRLTNATPGQAAFLRAVLDEFATRGISAAASRPATDRSPPPSPPPRFADS
ncbi:RAMP superfamily protein [Mycobacterium kansasii]|uniref:RAMP superfamily protein n=1 Tax=Mycobacterium kansasii TaxID=1768 RepID=A0A1V3WFK1_MYCKA|nr:RAMP superfamily protein [Mycobacterium kansasii]